jgi:hypothetical protein
MLPIISAISAGCMLATLLLRQGEWWQLIKEALQEQNTNVVIRDPPSVAIYSAYHKADDMDGISCSPLPPANYSWLLTSGQYENTGCWGGSRGSEDSWQLTASGVICFFFSNIISLGSRRLCKGPVSRDWDVIHVYTAQVAFVIQNADGLKKCDYLLLY